jgi:pimeloyl-ACP methyl ester carboxylesterase
MNRLLDTFWHRTLKQSYRLSVAVDEGSGQPVVLIHGLGSSSAIWEHVVTLLPQSSFRIIAVDLLGFGASPKPEWPAYNVDDHAKALIASLDRLHLSSPPILVGHSMGCLVAVRIARLRPDLAGHLILYEMPLYDGLPERRVYRLRLNAYRALYKRIATYEPVFSPTGAPLVQRIGLLIAGFELTEQTWLPFKRSLENTIMTQTASQDIKHIAVSMDVIYGRRDILVIRGKPRKIFGEDNAAHIKSYTVNANHSIPKSAGKFIVSRISEAPMARS